MSLSDVADLSMSLSDVAVPINGDAEHTAAGFGVIIAVPSVLGFLFLSIAPEHCPPLTVGAVNLVAFGIVVGVCAGYV